MSQRGSVRKRGRTWTCYWFVRDSHGKRVQKSKGGFQTRRDAQAHLTTVLEQVQSGMYIEPSRLSLEAYLRDQWLPSLDLRPSTMSSYRDIVDGWIVPRLGGYRIGQLTPKAVADFYSGLRDAPRRDGRGTISGRTAQYIATILRKALQDASRLGVIARNPAATVARPRARRAEMSAWTAMEVGEFLHSLDSDRLYAGWLLLAARGIRRGELLGLRWVDVDLDAGRLSIRQTLVDVRYGAQFSEPKTSKGRRVIPLDDTLVTALKAHRRRQLEERLAWGEGWVDTGLVFCREDGTAIHPQSLSQTFERLVRRANLRPIRLHDLRHTCATLSLGSGIPTKVVSEWLGHATTAMTDDLYRHVTPAMLEDAGARLTVMIVPAESSTGDYPG
jgi:integrase